MFRTLAPALSDALENYHYDHVTRVALGYTAANRPANPPVSPPDMIFAALNHTDANTRTPEGGLLVQSAVRVPLDRTDEAALVASVVETLGWQAPDVAYVNYWREADPLTVTGPAPFLQNLPDALPDERRADWQLLPATGCAGAHRRRTRGRPTGFSSTLT